MIRLIWVYVLILSALVFIMLIPVFALEMAQFLGQRQISWLHFVLTYTQYIQHNVIF